MIFERGWKDKSDIISIIGALSVHGFANGILQKLQVSQEVGISANDEDI